MWRTREWIYENVNHFKLQFHTQMTPDFNLQNNSEKCVSKWVEDKINEKGNYLKTLLLFFS